MIDLYTRLHPQSEDTRERAPPAEAFLAHNHYNLSAGISHWARALFLSCDSDIVLPLTNNIAR